MRALIAGNWKMHGMRADVARMVGPLREAAPGLGCDLLVCPPATLIREVAETLAGSAVAVGAQDCHPRTQGAHTGELSAAMLREAGANWVIVGHSERRLDHGETDALVRAKAEAAIAAGLAPIVCVGESERERRDGRAAQVVGAQLAGSLPDHFAGVVAYEPVWAIGTGLTPGLDDVATMHRLLRLALVERFGPAGGRVPILYGGSVKPGNAGALLEVAEVGGALVGGASLQPADFLAIAAAAPSSRR